MVDKPIIFSAPMVRALLDGRKTQTRRMAKITAIMGNKVPVTSPDESLIEMAPGEFRRGVFHYASTGALSGPYQLPYATCDRLYVREGFNAFQFSQDGGEAWPVDIPTFDECKEAEALGHRFGAPQIVYKESDRARKWFSDQKWRPSIHMPRWASRITLTVTDVRVQRLQEISEADAVAEGVDAVTLEDVPRQASMSRRSDFAALWNSIHGPEAWDANPWVAAYSFTVHRGNIYQIRGAA